MSSNPQYERLIQSGFEIIVKAFDEQNLSYEKTIEELQLKIKSLEKENAMLKEENEYYIKENKNLKIINEKMISSLNINDTKSKKGRTLSQQFKSSYIVSNYSTFKHSTPISNNLNTNDTDSNETNENDLIPKSSRNRSNILSPSHFTSLNESKSSKTFMFQRSKTKENGFTLFNSIKEEALFHKNCKENLSHKIFEKILLLINNYKSGLISSEDATSRIKALLKSNKELIDSYENIFQ